MSLAQLYSAVGGDVITAARWNNEFGNIYANGTDVAFPATKAVSFAGFTVTLDAAGVTTLSSSASQAFSLAPGSKAGTPGTNGSFINLVAGTFTDSNTAGSGTATIWNSTAFRAPTLAASNTLVATTNAATVYIEAAPINGTNETITNPWALWVDSGNVRFDDNLYWRSGTGFAGIIDHANTADRTYTFQNSSDTIVGRATTDTLTNKTLTAPVVSGTVTGTYTLGGTPTLPATAGASWVLIETLDLTSDEVVNDLGSTYDEHVFQLLNVLNSTGVDLRMTVSSDNGVSFANSSYQYSLFGTTITGATFILLAETVSAAAGNSLNGWIHCYRPHATSTNKMFRFNLCYNFTGTGIKDVCGAGMAFDNSPDVFTNAINAVRIFFSAGSIVSGTLRHYGIKYT